MTVNWCTPYCTYGVNAKLLCRMHSDAFLTGLLMPSMTTPASETGQFLIVEPRSVGCFGEKCTVSIVQDDDYTVDLGLVWSGMMCSKSVHHLSARNLKQMSSLTLMSETWKICSFIYLATDQLIGSYLRFDTLIGPQMVSRRSLSWLVKYKGFSQISATYLLLSESPWLFWYRVTLRFLCRNPQF